MSRNAAVQRLARRVQAMPEPAPPQLPEPEIEPQELAREIVRPWRHASPYLHALICPA